MLGGLDYHSIAVAVRRALSTVGAVLNNPANTTQALIDGATINWDASSGAIATVTLGGSRILAAPTNLKVGGRYVLEVTQDGTGSRGLTFNAVFRGLGGQAVPQPYAVGGSRTVYTFTSPDGTNLDLEGSQVNLLVITASLGADVLLNNTGLYFDGPTIAQGSVGTWLVTGTETLANGATANAQFSCKLWDGTSAPVASCQTIIAASSSVLSVSLSGTIINPVGNIRMSVRDLSSVNGSLLFNQTGNSKDCTITAVRIA